jgi:thiamine-phosphate pyrophosphorylase
MNLPPLYPILDTATLAQRGMEIEEAAAIFLSSGAGILQLRHKEHFTRTMFETAERVAVRCRQAGVPFIVNDRADIARMLDAGLHLGQDDLPPAAARAVIGQRTLGFSTHNEAQLKAALENSTADYLALGPIFGTQSKANPDPVVGLANASLWRKHFAKPMVAIGGITLAHAPAVLDAGFSSVAVISGLYPDPLTPATLRERIALWQSTLRAN